MQIPIPVFSYVTMPDDVVAGLILGYVFSGLFIGLLMWRYSHLDDEMKLLVFFALILFWPAYLYAIIDKISEKNDENNSLKKQLLKKHKRKYEQADDFWDFEKNR